MQQRSDKNGPARDEALKRDVEDQLVSDPQPEGHLVGGTPYGMDESDVSERTDLARFLGRAAFPADRLGLLRVLAENHAPDTVIDRLAGLPAGTTFANFQQVATALGIGVERARS